MRPSEFDAWDERDRALAIALLTAQATIEAYNAQEPDKRLKAARGKHPRSQPFE